MKPNLLTLRTGTHLRHNGDSLTSDGSVGNAGAIFSGWTRSRTPALRISGIIQTETDGHASPLSSPLILSNELERVSCTGRWEEDTYERRMPPLNETAAVAKIATEPVSLWLMRQYMRTEEIRLGQLARFCDTPPR